ncbi:MAG: kelch motif-containing protein, partial [Planctomycetes bacterium]|nr:kelch motif-containing protein [Planctomycetota bacterium]
SLLNARMQTPRYYHTSVLLPNGNPLVLGGVSNTANLLATMEVYDLRTGAWVYAQPTMGGPISGGLQFTGRYAHQSMMLPDMSILSIGGYTAGTAFTADLYWPSLTTNGTQGTAQFTGTFMACGRDLHTATQLTSGYGQGLVVVVGGERMDYVFTPIAIDTYEVYDHNVTVQTPAVNGNQGAWTPGAMPMKWKRCEHTSTLLGNGKILVVGGYNACTSSGGSGADSAQMRTAEILDPFGLGYNVNGPWAGIDQTGMWDWTRDPQGNWTMLGGLITGIGKHTATMLKDGRVLIAGGRDWIPPMGPALSRNLAWLYNP